MFVAAPRTTSICSSACSGVSKHLMHTSPWLLKVIPKNLKGKSQSAKDWLTRQLNDPYVKKAQGENYRARSAFKLLEINEQYKLLRPGLGVVECGCAPGAWTQVVLKHCCVTPKKGDSAPQGRVVGVDLLTSAPLAGAVIIPSADFTLPETQKLILQHLMPNKLDLVLSDMAPNATGDKALDHERIMRLVYHVAQFAKRNAVQGSGLLCKIWAGSRLDRFRLELGVLYDRVKIVKPPCSRDNSKELFIYGSGLKNAYVESDSNMNATDQLTKSNNSHNESNYANNCSSNGDESR